MHIHPHSIILKIITPFFPPEVVDRVSSEGFRKYFFHTGWNLVGRMLNLVISFFVSIYVVRMLGPEDWGTLSYVISFTALFSFIASLGIDSILYVDLVKQPERRDELLGTGFFIKLFGSALAFILALVFSVFLGDSWYTTGMVAIVSCAFFFQPFNVINLSFQAGVNSKPTVINTLVVSLILAVSKIGIVFFGGGLLLLAGVFLLEGLLTAAGYVYIYRRAGLHIRAWKFQKVVMMEMLASSWPLIFSSAFAVVYSRIDQVFIKHLITDRAVGLYDVAVRLSELWYLFPSIFAGSLLPAIMNVKSDPALYAHRLKRLYSFTIYLALFFIIPLSFLAPLLIRLFYGEAYLGAVSVLRIYVWAGVSVSIGTVLTQYLMSEKFTGIALTIALIGMICNIALNIWFIPLYGIEGAAWATLISYSIVPLCVLFFNKTRWQGRLIIKSIFFK